ncbi:hypothetical protein BDZ91DRAFT_213865 [Kalaharituber pfeilii]|nr:hypothetical protein BDZ91DRAFT_213865 [Kalaharituber pfeilii]
MSGYPQQYNTEYIGQYPHPQGQPSHPYNTAQPGYQYPPPQQPQPPIPPYTFAPPPGQQPIYYPPYGVLIISLPFILYL